VASSSRGMPTEPSVTNNKAGPVLIVSVNALQSALNLARVCAVTTHGDREEGVRNDLEVPIPAGLPAKGVILPRQLRRSTSKHAMRMSVRKATSDRMEARRLSIAPDHGQQGLSLPVVVDQTADDDENVPDRFREMQCTRLPGGDIGEHDRCDRRRGRSLVSALARWPGARAGPPSCKIIPRASSSGYRGRRDRRPLRALSRPRRFRLPEDCRSCSCA
jgi:mRNA-degrading endonuclease toxin of MazEF toxin-antitoxin module